MVFINKHQKKFKNYSLAKQLEIKEKISKSKMGHIVTKETRKKISLAFKGKTFEEIHGEEKAKEIKKKLSNSLLLYYKNLVQKRKHTNKTKEKMRQSAYKHKPKYKNTKPEVLLQNALKKEKIEFETHKTLFGTPDIFIVPNICIFVDGEYWHNYPDYRELDINVDERLINSGYIVLRFWATHEIELNINTVINSIKLHM